MATGSGKTFTAITFIYRLLKFTKKKGGTIWKGYIEVRDRLSRKKRYELQDEDTIYSSKQLDKDIVNPDQIRNFPKIILSLLMQLV